MQKEKSQRQAQLQQLKGASARSLQSQGGQKLSSKALHKGQESSRDLTASSGGSRKVLDSGTAEAQSQGPLAQDAGMLCCCFCAACAHAKLTLSCCMALL